MDNKTRLKIGEFSRLMQVTVKTLRHYEQKELLIPDEVDEWTGYRYYSVGQMLKLNSIRNLQRLGFKLEEIRDLYDEESHVPSVEQLTEKIKETESQLQQLIARRKQDGLSQKIRTDGKIHNRIIARSDRSVTS